MRLETPISDTVQHMVAGTLGGFMATVSLYPLELIKTRMQVIDGNSSYRSMQSSFRTVLANEGMAGLYRGVTPAAVAASGSWGGYFYFYEASKRRRMEQGTTGHRTISHLLSGVEAGVIMVFVFNPVWVVKTRLALQGAESHATEYRGLTHALSTILREEGIRGLYRGLIPALILTSHGAIQFATYEGMKTAAESFLSHSQQEQPPWVSLLLGGLSKIVASTITYPYQLIKSRLQQRNSSLYTGTFDCARKIWRQDGMLGFFRGVIPNALKVAPGSAVTFVVYEECMKILRKASADKAIVR